MGAMALAMLACDGSGSGDRPTGVVEGKATVFAAASLAAAFQEIGSRFEERHSGAEIEFNFAGTPTLRAQLEQGARADVFASADAAQMDIARKAGLVNSASRIFARNSLVIITPVSSRAGIDSPRGLAKDIKVVLAAAEVPAGAYARQALAAMERDPEFGAGFAAEVLANVVSLESNVKQVVAKVELGEADAGIVYGSDVTADVARKLRVIEIPPQFNVVVEYPLGLLREARNTVTATAFIDYVLSDEGQQILGRHGFLRAP